MSTFSIKSKQRRIQALTVNVKAGTIALSIDAAQVTNATNSFESTAHGLVTGDRILATADNTLPTGLTAIQYWIIKTDDDNFQLASTYANAIAGTAVAISDDGVDANSYDLVEEIDGLDKASIVGNIQATAVGTYVINIPAGTYFDADAFNVKLTAHIRDIVLSEDRSARTASQITVLVDSLDETAALVDGFFSIELLGSAIEDRY